MNIYFKDWLSLLLVGLAIYFCVSTMLTKDSIVCAHHIVGALFSLGFAYITHHYGSKD